MDDFPEEVRREIAAHHEQYLRDPKGAHLWDPIVIGVSGGPVPCLLLHHTGRKSGQPLYTILQYYQHAGEIAIVASKGGVTHHPVWYLNLVANPRCEVQIGEMRWRASARTIAEAERAAWWARITLEQPVQIEYQKRTAREIPILLLDRVS